MIDEGLSHAHTCDNGGDWGAWLSAMEGARVTVTVTNNGDGTADIMATIIGNGGEEFWQKYESISISDPDDVFFRFTVDGSCRDSELPDGEKRSVEDAD